MTLSLKGRLMYLPNALNSLSRDEIRAFIVQRLRAALPGLDLQSQQDQPFRLTLTHPEAGDVVLNLGNLVHEVQGAAPRAAEKMVETFVSLAQRAVEPPEINKKTVYPGLRHRAFLDATGQKISDRMIGDGPGDMVTVVLSDQGDGIATLNEACVALAGHTPESLLVAAEQNFVELLPGAFRASSTPDGVLSLRLEGYPWLGTSLLFVPLLLSRVMEDRGWSRALIAAPTRETVDLVDADAPGAARVLERWMADKLAGPRTQSEMVLSFRQGSTDYSRSYRMVGEDLVRLN